MSQVENWYSLRWRYLAVTASFVASIPAMVIPSTLVAQTPATVDSVLPVVPRTPLPSSLATISTDTGDFAPGHRDFTRYDTPGLCAAAAITTADVLRNTLAASQSYDTLRDEPDKDTLPSQASQTARNCGAKFTLANTTPAVWGSLFNLQLLAGDDSLAQATLERRVAAAPPAEREALQRDALDVYLGRFTESGIHRAEPGRLQRAEALVAQWDAGPNLMLRLYGHSALLQYGEKIKDRAFVERELAEVSTLAHKADTAKDSVPVVGTVLQASYEALAHLAYYVSASDLHAVAERAQQDLHRFTSDSVCARWFAECRKASVDEMASHLSWVWASGPSVPPIHATYWFAPAGKRLASSIPVPGHITIILHQSADCQIDTDWLMYSPICYGVNVAVQRWLQRYGAQGVDIVFGQSEWGFAFLGSAESPPQEAERLRWYYQDLVGLPVTVAVQTPTWRVLPEPDGRRFRTVNNTLFNDVYPNVSVTIVGRDGREITSTQIVDGTDTDNFGLVEDEITRALRIQPASSTAYLPPSSSK